jgi:hypothetical protein
MQEDDNDDDEKREEQHRIAVVVRATRLARVGAYSKVVSSSGCGLKRISDQDAQTWAMLLLPVSEEAGWKYQHGDVLDQETVRPEKVSTRAGGADRRKAVAELTFPPMVAPGPSGFRGGHLRELLWARNRTAWASVREVVNDLIDLAADGDLPERFRWLSASVLVLLEKSNKKAPRPIRCGETLATFVARVLSADIQEVMTSSRCRSLVPLQERMGKGSR